MFERRLKVVLGIIAGAALVVLLRCAWVQIVHADYWRQKAAESLRRTQLIETIRGRILDCRGRELAVDEPAIDAAVDYRAIVRDPQWMRRQALERLRRSGEQYARADRAARQRMLEEELARLNADLDEMWRMLAEVSGRTLEDIQEIQAGVRRRVEMRRRQVWYARYERELRRRDARAQPWYRQWLLSDAPEPQVDSFAIEVAEQTQSHVILNAVSAEAHNRLKKNLERFPGLELRPSTHRFYPYGSAACHVLGHLAAVTREDLQDDPNSGDELRQYYPNDLAGRVGIEAMAEQALRGVRGRIERMVGRDGIVAHVEPVPGRDVRITLDIELQMRLEEAFRHVEWREEGRVVEAHEMHGAAVVIDVPTGEVRALVSWPTYDLNSLAQLYPTLVADAVNQPLLNRATQVALEPGSTVKPVVGIAAVTMGLIGAQDTIECTGFLVIDGQKQSFGRCWVASRFLSQLGPQGVAHHQVPWSDPHPTGFLTFADALQRSCNVFFEVVGDRMGLDALAWWFGRFGLGSRTCIGLAESPGRLPSAGSSVGRLRSTRWFAAIGQSQVLATPIQMANVAATIARDGIWMRPVLIAEGQDTAGISGGARGADDRRDLGLSRAALAAAREGMYRVVNTRAGTGYQFRRSDIEIAAKTGTAQASMFAIVKRDSAGRPMRDERGRLLYDFPPISTRARPNPAMPWYRGSGHNGTDLSHAWVIGFAPASSPQIAFAVMMEYGGSGGHDAAPLVNALIDACLEHGYLRKEGN